MKSHVYMAAALLLAGTAHAARQDEPFKAPRGATQQAAANVTFEPLLA